MVYFKVYGERNSGTNFLNKVLIHNKFPVLEQVIKDNICYDWKHGIPRNSIKNNSSKIVCIFVFRELKEWLISMHREPYHLKNYEKFSEFIQAPQTCCTNLIDKKTKKFLNKDDEGKNLFEIRYHKFNHIKYFMKKFNDVIFVNLKYIQRPENLKYLLREIEKKYLNIVSKDYYITRVHTKTRNSITINRSNNINIDDSDDIIKEHQNQEIEDFINNLTYIIK